ncbi:hypothetical protein GLW08_05780 [Pontibacillus yanchengensis]|uniref:Uncharacterized protein n=2 Tax=Pontibacillus yanchengensis TaxID=462910 RepID=A0ACC7VF61_9BACI|nr:beta-propeller domain-containing protein [Pontibacillus yanchengensis]MYL32266.1 hypothetical protein [Pontibacillus yanchengensis]MYL52846.1 hypothetical protein [Pontibacillus yanchengensis]
MKRLYMIMAAVVVSIFAIFSLQQHEVLADVGEDEAKVVPVHKNWTVTFSKQMDEESFTYETVNVTSENNQEMDISFQLSEDGKTLKVQSPEEGYPLNQQFTLKISSNVTSAEGKQMKQDFTLEFQTRDELPSVGSKENFIAILDEMQKNQETRYQTFDAQATAESADSSASSEESASADSASSGNDTSKTNVQVDGVDEGDVVKTDGKNFYFARQDDILITRGHPAGDSQLLSEVQEEGFRPNELYIYEDRLIVMGTMRDTFSTQKKTEQDGVAKEMIYPYYRGQTAAYVYDVTNPSKPEKIREVTVQGNFLTSRKIDETLYFITNEHPPFHIMNRAEEEGESVDKEELRPMYKDTAVSSEAMSVSYDRMHKLPETDDSSFLTITSFDVTKEDQEAEVKTYLGSGDTVYMSKENIYLAVRDYPEYTKESVDRNQTPDTRIYQFGVDGTKVSYDAETNVPGTLINQFAMDERDGTFRVATTKGNMWDEENTSTNNLYTFDTSLNKLGELEGLAEGERIYSVRFMQNRAYMVTFKQVDPLFVIDLQNAEAPEVLGKLKIPGFSNYLHPIGDNHVIGFGNSTKQTENNRTVTDGVKLSLFDISDVSNPIEKDVEIIGGSGSSSDLNYNHKALYYHPDKNLFGFPVTVSESYKVQQGDAEYMKHRFVFEGAYLYNVTPEDGFTLKKTISHQPDKELDHPQWENKLQRMMSINNYLYSFSNKQMEVLNLETEEQTNVVEFPWEDR